LRGTGSFPQANTELEQRRRGEDDVLSAVQRSPSTNISSISRMTRVVQTQVWRFLDYDGFYPYHVQRGQHLLSGDHANRVRICEWLQHIPRNTLFTDKAQLTGGGVTKREIRTYGHTKIHIS
jgi:hypothetical protein